MRQASRGGASGAAPAAEKQAGPVLSSAASHNIEPLRRKNYELEEEVRLWSVIKSDMSLLKLL